MVVLLGKAFPREPLVGDFPGRRCERPALMRLAHIRVLAACLISGGSLGWGLVSGPQGIPAASALTTPAAARTALSSQCEPLPAAASASPTGSPSNPPELCVSVQPPRSSIKPGQAASYTVEVSAENGPASGVSVTLTATPQGQQPEFTSLCPSGNGTATCTIGSLATTVSPSAYQMHAQIQVASTATSVTSVTLTATADAATTPAMTTMPAAAAPVTVSAPAASPGTSPASTTRVRPPRSTTPARVTPAILPALASTPPLVSVPAVSTPVMSPVNISSALPVITPAANPVVGAQPSPAANVGTPAAGNFTVVIGMSAATAQLFGLIVAWLVLLLAATKLAGDRLAARRTQKKEVGPKTQKTEGTGKKRLWFWRPGHPARPRRWRAAPRHASHHGREAQFDVRALRPGPDSRRLIRGQVVQDHEEPVAAGPGCPAGSQRGQGVIPALVAPDHAPQQEVWIYRMP